MIPGCRVVELRADRTPGAQAQGAYTRVLRELRAQRPVPVGAMEEYAARVALRSDIRRARACALAVARDARRNAAEHTRQGLVPERFVHDSEEPDWGDDSWSRANGQ